MLNIKALSGCRCRAVLFVRWRPCIWVRLSSFAFRGVDCMGSFHSRTKRRVRRETEVSRPKAGSECWESLEAGIKWGDGGMVGGSDGLVALLTKRLDAKSRPDDPHRTILFAACEQNPLDLARFVVGLCNIILLS